MGWGEAHVPKPTVDPTPSQLWHLADGEHPNNEVARSARYIELMRDAGYIEDVPALCTRDDHRCAVAGQGPCNGLPRP